MCCSMLLCHALSTCQRRGCSKMLRRSVKLFSSRRGRSLARVQTLQDENYNMPQHLHTSHARTHTHTHKHIPDYPNINMRTQSIHAYIYSSFYIYVRIYVHIYIYIYIQIYVYVYTQKYTYMCMKKHMYSKLTTNFVAEFGRQGGACG